MTAPPSETAGRAAAVAADLAGRAGARMPKPPQDAAKVGAWVTLRAALAMLTGRELSRGMVCCVAIIVVNLILLASLAVVPPLVGLIVAPEDAAQSAVVAELRNFLGDPSDADMAMQLAVAALVLLVAGQLGNLGVMVWSIHFVSGLSVRLSRALVGAFAHVPYAWFLEQSVAELSRVVYQGVEYWSHRIVFAALRLTTEIFTVVTTAALIVVMVPVGGLLLMVLIGCTAALVNIFVKRRMTRWSATRRIAAGNTARSVQQLLLGIKDVQASGSQGYLLRVFNSAIKDRLHSDATVTSYAQLPPILLMLVVQASMLLVLMGLWMTNDSGASVAAQMAIIVVAAARILPAVNRIPAELSLVYGAAAEFWGMRRLIESSGMLDAPRGGGAPVPDAWRGVAFDRVDFRYRNAARDALTDVSFCIPRGRVVGLIGASGAGKTTCVDMLLGLLAPVSGSVRVDGAPLAELDLHDWRARIGYVPQQPFFADDTIADNIAFGMPRDAGRIAEAVRGAGLAELIADLPDGVDTQLGDRGLRVSGGQRQRIAIARALYRRPDMLVLDEATASLDSEAEQVVLGTVDNLKGGITIVIITHRESTLAVCDRIVEIRAGKVVADRAAEPRLQESA